MKEGKEKERDVHLFQVDLPAPHREREKGERGDCDGLRGGRNKRPVSIPTGKGDGDLEKKRSTSFYSSTSMEREKKEAIRDCLTNSFE